MLKILNYIYFNIFNSYYKNGRYKNDIPWVTAWGILSAALTFYTFSIISLLRIIRYGTLNGFVFPKPLGFAIGTFFMIVGYFLFLKNKRYLIIYNEFKKYDQTISNKRKGRIISWTFIFLSFIVFVIQPLLWRNDY
jgi:hypothetical protein